MPTTEHTINDALALVLRDGRHAWRGDDIVRSENTGMLRDGSGRPDILVLEPYVSPVAIETELYPAVTVESEATSRLGINIKGGRTILSSIAVRLPKRLNTIDSSKLHGELLKTTDFQMALFTGKSSGAASRWPRNQWISGSVRDLSILTQAASVPPEIVDVAADELMAGIREVAGLFAEVQNGHAAALEKISTELRQEHGEQTWRMAAAILANAFVFHESLANGPGKLATVQTLTELAGKNALNRAGMLAQWRTILEVNYWSIFDIARRILEHVPGPVATTVVRTLAKTAERLLEHRLMRSHDLTGAVFQRLIADRKFLAAYYTTPASAALLAGLAIGEDANPARKPWSDLESLRKVRIADFACGTGTLLSAAYQRVGQFHELARGNAKDLHAQMMGGSLVGCDVLPAAAHLTASSLASAHPTETYAQSSIMTLTYGRQPDGDVTLGSWNLLDPQARFEILAITAKAAHGTGEVTEEIWSSVPHEGFDLVIMNPPFTRPTGHEGEKIGVRNPMFAAFRTNARTQKLMGALGARLTKGTSYHGNAGEASAFLVLADRKLKKGGTLALVLPLSFMLGEAWEDSRSVIAKNYDDLIFVTNAGVGGADISFSSDTGMGECLIVGRKANKRSVRATYVTLNERPESPIAGSNLASIIQGMRRHDRLRRLEDGPSGGTPIQQGAELVGHALDAPINPGWQMARVRDFSVAQTAFQLLKGKLWLPTMKAAHPQTLPVTTIESIAQIGPYHADINGRTQKGGIRGPFDIVAHQESGVPTYPVLWSHEADRERFITFEAESEAVPRVGRNKGEKKLIEDKVEALWQSASFCHFNQNFQFNSQSTAMQYTRHKTIGGRAWLSLSLPTKQQEMALTLWANSTLGILLYWWIANKQQLGRGNIGKSALQRLPILDVTNLSKSTLSAFEDAFGQIAQLPLRPIHQMGIDVNRQRLDTLVTAALGLPDELQAPDGPMELVRLKLAREPSVLGSKKA